MQGGTVASIVILCLVLGTGGCASAPAERYARREPMLVLERFFDGQTTAVGTVLDRSGAVIRRFRATADGAWSDADRALTVSETWYWDDGEVEPRRWRWEKLDGGAWRGLEDDLVAPADGMASGNTVHWTYAMRVDTRDYGELSIWADDVMHLIDDDNIINLVDMYYLGIYVGKVVLHIQRGGARRIDPWPTAGAP